MSHKGRVSHRDTSISMVIPLVTTIIKQLEVKSKSKVDNGVKKLKTDFRKEMIRRFKDFEEKAIYAIACYGFGPTIQNISSIGCFHVWRKFWAQKWKFWWKNQISTSSTFSISTFSSFFNLKYQSVRLMGSSQKSGLSWTGLLSGSESSKLMSGSVRSLTMH